MKNSELSFSLAVMLGKPRIAMPKLLTVPKVKILEPTIEDVHISKEDEKVLLENLFYHNNPNWKIGDKI